MRGLLPPYGGSTPFEVGHALIDMIKDLRLILFPLEHDLGSLGVAQVQSVRQGKGQFSMGIGFPEIDGLACRLELGAGGLAGTNDKTRAIPPLNIESLCTGICGSIAETDGYQPL